MGTERSAVHGAVLWAVIGAAIAFASLPSVNDDARVLVGVLSVLGPAAAVAAAVAAGRDARRLAGVLLVASALLTPTYFAYAVNAVPLLGGLWLAARPGRTAAATG